MLISKMDNKARGITYYNNKICFVNNALIGEDVDIKIILDKKKYSVANVSKYNSFSENRVKPKCKYYELCGGCNLQHLSYDNQIKYKYKMVNETLKEYGMDIEIVTDKDFYYRNKLTLHSKDNKLGLYDCNYQIIEIDECMLCNKSINEKLKYLKLIDISKVDEIIIKSFNDDVLINIVGKINDIENIKPYFNHLYLNNKCISKDKLIATIGDIKYYVSGDTFFQVNPYITYKLYNYIKQLCTLIKSSRVLDLYCGSGTISLYIASVTKYVFGVEINKQSIEDAYLNKELNKIDNVDFRCSDTNNIDTYKGFDTIIVDPPRSGLSKTVINHINKSRIQNIIYISCNIDTLKRDIDSLNYNVQSIKVFDMFPNTYHVESVTLLRLKTSEK